MMTINPRGGDKSKIAKKEKNSQRLNPNPALRTQELTEHVGNTIGGKSNPPTIPSQKERNCKYMHGCIYEGEKRKRERERERERKREREKPGDVGSKSQ